MNTFENIGFHYRHNKCIDVCMSTDNNKIATFSECAFTKQYSIELCLDQPAVSFQRGTQVRGPVSCTI